MSQWFWNDGNVIHELEIVPGVSSGHMAWAKCASDEPREGIKPGSLDANHGGIYKMPNQYQRMMCGFDKKRYNVTCPDCLRLKEDELNGR